MDIYKELSLLESYDMWLVIIGFSALIITALPRLLSDYPFSMSIVLLLVGFGAVSLPLGLEAPNPFEQGTLVEQLTELGIILSFMDRKSTRLNSSHVAISYAVFCLKKKKS